MKNVAFVFLLFVCGFAKAEQLCTMQWDGKVYQPRTLEAGEVTSAMNFKSHTKHRYMDATGTVQEEPAELLFKMLKQVPVDTVIGTCKHTGVGAWDRITTAVYFEASSDKPVFGSPVDAASRKTIKAWGLCQGLILRECP